MSVILFVGIVAHLEKYLIYVRVLFAAYSVLIRFYQKVFFLIQEHFKLWLREKLEINLENIQKRSVILIKPRIPDRKRIDLMELIKNTHIIHKTQ